MRAVLQNRLLLVGTTSRQSQAGGFVVYSIMAKAILVAALILLTACEIAPESDRTGFDRAHFHHHADDLCDQSGTDPYTGLPYTPDTCDVDHIVSAAEAWESGAHAWTEKQRQTFGRDLRNLAPSRDCVNRSKQDHDIAEWSGTVKTGPCAGTILTDEGRYWWALRTVEVKTAYNLDMDLAEISAIWHIFFVHTP